MRYLVLKESVLKRSNILIPVGIYLVTLVIVLLYNLSHPLVNDGVWEYHTYLLNITEGWQFRPDSLNSCLVPFWIPSLIQGWTNWDAMPLFRVFPAFFYALMPAFVYLIARRYLDLRDSIVASLVIIFSSYIFFFPDVGRIGITLGFMSGMIWALLGKRLMWAVAFAGLVVFSHYGTAIIAFGTLGAVLGGTLLMRWKNLKSCYVAVKPYLTAFCVLSVLTGVWHFCIAKYSGNVMWDAMFRQERLLLDFGGYGAFDLEGKDAVIQMAFGKGFLTNPLPLNIEIVVNWAIVAFITLGIYIMLRNKMIDVPFKIMSVALYGLILAVIAIPNFSIYYGVQRVYFTASIVLAICFPLGIRWMAGKLHVSPLLLTVAVLGLYALSTSGVIYLPFGLEKTIPIYVTLP